MSVLSRKSRRAESVPLSQDSVNRAIALGQYRQEAQPDFGESLLSQARSLKERGLFDEALSLLQPLLTGSIVTRLFQALMLQAEIHSERGNYAQAQASYGLLLEAVTSDNNLTALESVRMRGLVQLNAGWLYEQSGEFEACLGRYTQAIICFEDLCAEIPDQVLSSLMMAYRLRARIYRLQGLIPQALRDLEASTAAQSRILEPLATNTDILREWFSLGQLQQELGQWSQALASQDLALRQCAQLPKGPERERWIGMIQTQRALCCEHLSQPEAAIELYDQALAVFDAEREPLQWVLLRLLKIALQLRIEPDHLNAEQTFRELQESIAKLELAGTDRAELALPLLALASLCHAGDPDWGLDFYSTAIRCLEQTHKRENIELVRRLVEAYRGRSALLDLLGQPQKALASLKQGLRQAEMIADQELQADMQLQIGLVSQSLGKFDLAAKSFEQARLLDGAVEWAVRTPDDSWFRASYFLAFLLTSELNQLERALDLLLELDAACPHQVDYDLACLYARLQRPDQAFARLQAHLASPEPLSPEDITADSDLQSLQTDPRWQALLG